MLAAIRIRSPITVKKEINLTLKFLRLNKVNHLVLLPETKEIKGMLKKAEGFITWGEINKETIETLLKKRGRLKGNKKITENYLKKIKIKNFKGLAEELIKGDKTLKSVSIKPVFRLSPPSKGFERKGIKKHFNIGGVLGDRKEKINELINKMM